MTDRRHSFTLLSGLVWTGLVAAVAQPVFAEPPSKVFCTNGNVVLSKVDGQQVRLIETGLDFDPVLSPDGKTVAFARRTPGKTIEAAFDPEDANEIWVIGADGTKARKVAEGRTSDDMRDVLTGLCKPAFAPDGKAVYFLSSAWVTSRAIHRVRLEDLTIAYVAPGNTLEVVQNGEYTGCLITRQHRYWLAGGSYNWYWLLTPEGKEVGPIGDENGLANFHDLHGK